MTEFPFILGRDADCHVFFNNITVSRKHAVVACEGDIYTIKDLDSTNGVKINGAYIKSGVEKGLRHMDKVELGDILLQFQKEDTVVH